MQIALIIDDPAKVAAISRATAAFNEKNAPVSEQEFVTKLVEGQIATLVKAYVPNLELSPTDFQKRFTQAERIAIRQAGFSSAEVADYLAMTVSAQSVTLTDPLTIEGVRALETAGLIAPGRAAEILAL